jgi:hypothetical protein
MLQQVANGYRLEGEYFTDARLEPRRLRHARLQPGGRWPQPARAHNVAAVGLVRRGAAPAAVEPLRRTSK